MPGCAFSCTSVIGAQNDSHRGCRSVALCLPLAAGGVKRRTTTALSPCRTDVSEGSVAGLGLLTQPGYTFEGPTHSTQLAQPGYTFETGEKLPGLNVLMGEHTVRSTTVSLCCAIPSTVRQCAVSMDGQGHTHPIWFWLHLQARSIRPMPLATRQTRRSFSTST